MSIKSADQITIVDVTDAYSVMLTSEAYTFVGGTGGVESGQSCATEVVAFCGTNQCSTVSVNKEDIVCPTGITAAVANSGSSKVKITFTTTATITTACEATIPVLVDGITMNKKFSFAVAKAGNNGTNGKDAITLSITSSNGTIFKNNSGSTVLTAHVFKGGVEQTVADNGTVSGIGTVKWYKSGSTTAVATSKTLSISAKDVANSQAYTCQLED